MSAHHHARKDDIDPIWMSEANPCKSSGINFFPEDGGRELQAAIKLCLTCPNRELCLDYALRNNIHDGVWGGQSERGRKRIAKSRRHFAA